jgi:hypothetical protein
MHDGVSGQRVWKMDDASEMIHANLLFSIHCVLLFEWIDEWFQSTPE